MDFSRSLFYWLFGLLSTVVAVIASYLELDRPVALWVHYHLRRPHRGVINQLAHIPDPIVLFAIAVFLLLGLQTLLGRSLSKHRAAAFVCSVSVIFTETIKDLLKFFFGRTWPETWTENNPSFINNGVYGFHFMHGGKAYQAFPSGHMAATCAVIAVLWIAYPRFRWLYTIIGILAGAGLVGMNYHFLSDIIAGAFVGVSTSWMVMAIWDASNRNSNTHC